MPFQKISQGVTAMTKLFQNVEKWLTCRKKAQIDMARDNFLSLPRIHLCQCPSMSGENMQFRHATDSPPPNFWGGLVIAYSSLTY